MSQTVPHVLHQSGCGFGTSPLGRNQRVARAHVIAGNIWSAGYVSSCWPAAARFSQHGQRARYGPLRWLGNHAHCPATAT